LLETSVLIYQTARNHIPECRDFKVVTLPLSIYILHHNYGSGGILYAIGTYLFTVKACVNVQKSLH